MPHGKNEFSNERPERQETLIRFMEISENTKPGDRVAALEQKTDEMEALLKGLMAEMLDFKAIAMKLAQQNDAQARQEPARGHIVQGTIHATPETPDTDSGDSGETHTVIIQHSSSKPEVPAAPPEPEMVRIMQPDGTMKMEVRRGDKGLHR
ncbi:hypothetical protein Mboo_0032 [Methanoregula boonei 6A8]|uniref:Uncharacterized protein n=2 Tax=Methanoregula TaxID=395331 RepID=A7I495_METB6|nr:hypothetical protein Mboo_0032 [Methanoregula boonei 6A8]